MKEKLLTLQSMIEPDFDWDKYCLSNRLDEGDGNGCFEELFEECFKLHDYGAGTRPIGTIECGSHKFKDSPTSMYRFLWLMKPKSVDFSDMYKSETLIEVCSPDYEFCVAFAFFKYEFSCRFHVAEKHILDKRTPGRFYVQCGIPGSDTGKSCSSDIGNLWFSVLMKTLDTRHCLYGGNDFYV